MSIEQTALNKAINILNALGAEYAIRLGEEAYGTLEIAPPRTRRAALYPRGVTHDYFWPLLCDMQPGEMRQVPLNGFDGAILARNISSACARYFGAGNAMTSLDRDKDRVTVLRDA
jgi:hypothetical protein